MVSRKTKYLFQQIFLFGVLLASVKLLGVLLANGQPLAYGGVFLLGGLALGKLNGQPDRTPELRRLSRRFLLGQGIVLVLVASMSVPLMALLLGIEALVILLVHAGLFNRMERTEVRQDVRGG